MNVEQLIAELQKLPKHLDVAVQRKRDGDNVLVAVSDVRYEGRFIELETGGHFVA